MSLARRRALIDLRAHVTLLFSRTIIIRVPFQRSPLPCLQGLDNAGRVICGDDEQDPHPSLRLGYLLVPEQLVD